MSGGSSGAFEAVPEGRRRTRILLAGSAAIGVALLPAWIGWALRQWQIQFKVVLTAKALSLVSAKALAVLTENPVALDGIQDGPMERVLHVDLATWPDAIFVVPASADVIGKLAHGIADDLLTTVLLSSPRPTVLVPSISGTALQKPTVQRNLATLQADGYGLVPMPSGLQVSDGSISPGAMADAPTAFAYLWKFLRESQPAVSPKAVLTVP
jgi:phosphopantothenoylcysteine decarboxylase/phosphopantothenate--cysteine ligase